MSKRNSPTKVENKVEKPIEYVIADNGKLTIKQ